ncbi:hypothetical protein [Aquipuribacter nitratireducens]|uniref:Fibronectin type-III domain-containing protein n=1 Tax=Aquipuribacter nitratireducens TaxID=650104 RepID=A0ABW0GP98_9MICO
MASTLLAALVATLVAAPAAPALAAWTTPAHGLGQARTRSLSAPGSVTPSCSFLLPGGIDVLWPVSPTVPTARYRVERTSDAGATWTVVAAAAAGPPVTDAPGILGTYRYRVTTTAGSWSSATSPVSPSRTITLSLTCL